MSSNEESGYIHHISPTKKSNEGGGYFNFELQTSATDFKHGVCYDDTLKRHFQGFEKSRSPVKLKNIPEKRGQNRDLMDVIVTKRARLEEAPNAELCYEYDVDHPDPEIAAALTVAQIYKIKSCQLVTVEGRVTVVDAEIKEAQIRGETKRLNENVVLTDDTGSIPLTLWEDFNDTVQSGVNYKLASLRVKCFNGCRVTTTPSTELDAVLEQYPEPDQSTIASLFDIYEVTLEAIELAEDFRRWYCCRRCNKALIDISSVAVATCASCKAVQRAATCSQNVSVKIAVEEEVGKLRSLTLFSRELNAMLDKYNSIHPEDPVTQDSEPDKVYLALLLLPTCTIKYRKMTNLVTEVRFQ